MNKGMAERTIDAQRVSGERWGFCLVRRVLLGASMAMLGLQQHPATWFAQLSGLINCKACRLPRPLPPATVPRDTVQLYQQLRESGLQYGPAFRQGGGFGLRGGLVKVFVDEACPKNGSLVGCRPLQQVQASKCSTSAQPMQAASQRARSRHGRLLVSSSCRHGGSIRRGDGR